MRTHKIVHKMASNEGGSLETMCSFCFNNTKYRCMQCYNPVCNRCSIAEINDDLLVGKQDIKLAIALGVNRVMSKILTRTTRLIMKEMKLKRKD